MAAPNRSDRKSQQGFSLIELLIAMVIAVEVLVAALTVFDVHNRMSRIQMQITEVQQSLRVGQYDILRTTRMAARGGLRAQFRQESPGSSVWLTSDALAVRNNLIDDSDREVARGFGSSPRAVPGTDMLIVRGCLSGGLLQVNASNVADYQPDPDGNGVADNGLLVLRTEALLGRQQSLSQLTDPQFFDSATGTYSPIVLQSAVNREQYAIVEVTGVNADVSGTFVTLNLDFLPNDDTPNNPLVGLADLAMSVNFVCVLEEYRYYIRENFSIAGDASSQLLPRLSRARMIPGTETPYRNDLTNLSLDIADEIIDLQVALAFDTDFDLDGSLPGSFDDDDDALGNDDVLYEGTDDEERGTDDWLWNSSEDDPTAPQYLVNQLIPGRFVRLLTARVTLVGRSSRPDPSYDAPDLDPVPNHDWIEDNDYDAAPTDRWKEGVNRNHRRRILSTVVDLRNI